MHYDAIVVLGGGRNKFGDLTPLSLQRLDKGYELYKQGLAPKILALGGHNASYSSQSIFFDKTGAELRSEYLIQRGVPTDSIVLIQDGRDTIGEAFASRKAARKLKMYRLLIVTSDKHMKRSFFIFRRIFGKGYVIRGVEIPCGDLLNSSEEKEYLTVVKHFFETLPDEIPDSERWYEENAKLYHLYREIHDKYHQPGKESQAYLLNSR